VQGFVNAINSHRKERFDPSEMICVDECISRWYGLDGSWIDVGLPHYVAIDRKPENGCELQNSSCGQSGVMLRLKLVVTAEDEDADMQHGTRVLAELVSPWAGSGRVLIPTFQACKQQNNCYRWDLSLLGL
jgi:Transposase IS4